jgi:hypothetical protein
MLRSIAGAIWERVISDYIFRDAVDAQSGLRFRGMLFGYNRSALSDMRVRWNPDFSTVNSYVPRGSEGKKV